MNLRAHHLLCMKYFQGKGYSEEFVSNFYDVMDKLAKNPIIKLTNSVDVICKACRHLKNNKCMKKPDSEERVRKKDKEIMDILGLEPEQEIKIDEARSLVDLNLAELRNTCKECEWKEYCF